MLCLNAGWIFVEADYNHNELLSEASLPFQLMEHFFCIYFFGEWMFRFCAFQRKSNCMRDGRFVFDTVLVVIMFTETYLLNLFFLLFVGGSGGQSSSASRAIR